MCGIVGWINNHENLASKKKKIVKMTKTLKYRGPDDGGYYTNNYCMLGHRRLAIVDIKNGKQPMAYQNFIIIYNGELYNTDVIKEDLLNNNIEITTTSDTEVLLKGYALYKEKILDKIEGIFSFAIYNTDEKSIFLARDRLGVKPLYYSLKDNNFIFASEIKAILRSEIIEPIIDLNGLQELLALGPSHVPGSGIYKDIKELRAGHYLIFKNDEIKITRYWNVKTEKFVDDFDTCKEKVRDLLSSAIIRQMVSDVGVSSYLSGGLDSSIITAIMSQNYSKKLWTYSIDYKGNKKHFKSNDFQVSRDNFYIDIMRKEFNTHHQYKYISQKKLAKTLKDAVLAKDLPGMADIDSSLYWFSKQISKSQKVALSGECADEIFGGYPWFYKKELKNAHFPWITNLKERQALLNSNIKSKINLEKFAKNAYIDIIKEVPEGSDMKHRKLFYINMTYFMPTLLDRKDRMTMRTSLEVRVPFADHKLVEYLWNVPWEYKYYQNYEKGLLRESFKDILPAEITYRKKNPYPKTHHPKYAIIVSKLLAKRLKNKNSSLYKIFNIDELNKLIKTKGKSYQKPWFGQLMTGPQLIAYLYQFDLWAEKYKVLFDI